MIKVLARHAVRLALALVACWMIFASPCRAEVNPDCCQTPGDANGDDSVNVADVTFLIARIFSGGPAPRCLREGDANGSGKLNISDITYLIARIFAVGPVPVCASTPLPAPFPNEIGNWWEYERFDSLTLTVDTVHVEVTDTATLPNGELAKIWVSTVGGAIIATDHVSFVTDIAGDSVKVYEGGFVESPEMLYVYSLEVFREWFNAEKDDPGCRWRFAGGFPEAVQTPLQTFPLAFRIWRSNHAVDCWILGRFFDNRRVWLVNYLGVVRATRLSVDIQLSVTENKAWSLIDFDVTPLCDTCK